MNDNDEIAVAEVVQEPFLQQVAEQKALFLCPGCHEVTRIENPIDLDHVDKIELDCAKCGVMIYAGEAIGTERVPTGDIDKCTTSKRSEIVSLDGGDEGAADKPAMGTCEVCGTEVYEDDEDFIEGNDGVTFYCSVVCYNEVLSS